MLSAIYLTGFFIVIGLCGWLVWHCAEDPFNDINKLDIAGQFGILTALVALLWPVVLITLVLGIIALVLYVSWYARDEEDDD